MTIVVLPISNNYAIKYHNLIKNTTRQFISKYKINPDIQIFYNFVSSTKMAKLNNKYRNISRSTDVLSFPIWKNSQSMPKQGRISLGDVFICTSKVKENARHANTNFQTELKHIIIHSLRHLIGIHHNF